jgi:hypothetical protein
MNNISLIGENDATPAAPYQCPDSVTRLAGGLTTPRLKKRGSRFFFGAREDQPVLLRSRAICRLSRIFSEILQDRHRPPSDLADGLMRISSSGQNASLDKKIGIPVPWAGISRGGSPLHGKLNFF